VKISHRICEASCASRQATMFWPPTPHLGPADGHAAAHGRISRPKCISGKNIGPWCDISDRPHGVRIAPLAAWTAIYESRRGIGPRGDIHH
jgi:hypothetical protein